MGLPQLALPGVEVKPTGGVTLANSKAVAGQLKRRMLPISCLYFTSPILASFSYISHLSRCSIDFAQAHKVVVLSTTNPCLGSPNIDQTALYIDHADPLTCKLRRKPLRLLAMVET